MAECRHILITGDVGIGKSTLIRTLLRKLNRPVYGFETVKIDHPEKDGWRYYMFPAMTPAQNRYLSDENLIGIRRKQIIGRPEVFDTLGVQLIRAAKPDGILLMDELGFLESEAEAFQTAVLEALHGTIPVIAAVKKKDGVPFLNAVCACPQTVLYTVTPENRMLLADEIMQSELIFRE